jgi:hypothetical protein
LIYDLQPAVGGQMLWFSYGDSTCRNAANGAPCDAATVLTNSVERAYEYGWNYLEIYSADIVGLPSVIHYAHTLLTQSSPTPTPTPSPTPPAPSPPPDFNGNHRSDILLQDNSTGERVIWLMNGTSYSRGVSLGFVPTQWQIVGTGDFNGKGKTDILWQNPSTGERVIWLMNGTSYSRGVSLGVVPTQWQIAGTGDFNGDGKTDILWQNPSTGGRAIWLMNGTSYSRGVSLGFVPTQWEMRNH